MFNSYLCPYVSNSKETLQISQVLYFNKGSSHIPLLQTTNSELLSSSSVSSIMHGPLATILLLWCKEIYIYRYYCLAYCYLDDFIFFPQATARNRTGASHLPCEASTPLLSHNDCSLEVF